MISYGYNEGVVSDHGWGLVAGDGSTPSRAGYNFSSIDATAETFAFGDSQDGSNPAITADNNLATASITAGTSAMRHSGNWQMCFCDGHAKTIKFGAFAYNGFSAKKGQIGLPLNQAQGLYFCSMKDRAGDITGLGSGALADGYPLQVGNATCANAVADTYANSTLIK